MQPTRNHSFNSNPYYVDPFPFSGVNLPQNEPDETKDLLFCSLNPTQNPNQEPNVSLHLNEERSKFVWLNPPSHLTINNPLNLSTINTSLNLSEKEKDFFDKLDFNGLKEEVDKNFSELNEKSFEEETFEKTQVSKKSDENWGLNKRWEAKECKELKKYIKLAFKNGCFFYSRPQFINWAKKEGLQLNRDLESIKSHIKKVLNNPRRCCSAFFKKWFHTIVKESTRKKKSNIPPGYNEQIDKNGALSPDLSFEMEPFEPLSFSEGEELNHSLDEGSILEKTKKNSQKRKFSALEDHSCKKQKSTKNNLPKNISNKRGPKKNWDRKECEELKRYLTSAVEHVKNHSLFDSRSSFIIWAIEKGWASDRSMQGIKAHMIRAAKSVNHTCSSVVKKVTPIIFQCQGKKEIKK